MSKIDGFDHNDLDFPYWDDKAEELLNEDINDEGFDEFVKERKRDVEFLDDLEEDDD